MLVFNPFIKGTSTTPKKFSSHFFIHVWRKVIYLRFIRNLCHWFSQGLVKKIIWKINCQLYLYISSYSFKKLETIKSLTLSIVFFETEFDLKIRFSVNLLIPISWDIAIIVRSFSPFILLSAFTWFFVSFKKSPPFSKMLHITFCCYNNIATFVLRQPKSCLCYNMLIQYKLIWRLKYNE